MDTSLLSFLSQVFFSEQAVVALTVTLAHIALLGYLLLKTSLATSAARLLGGYLFLAAAWDFLVLAQEMGGLTRTLGYAWPLLPVYAAMALMVWLWWFNRAFLEWKSFGVWGWLGGVATLALLATLDFALFPLPLQSLLPLDRLQAALWLAGGAVIAYTVSAVRTIFAVQKRMYSPRHRNRIHFLHLSLLVAAAGLLLYLTTLPIAAEIGLLVHWLGALGLTTIVVNRHLPDIKTGFKELVSLTIVALFTFALYSASIYALEVWFTRTPRARFRTAVVAAILLTLFYPPLYRLIRRLTQRLLFRHQFNYSRIIKTYIQTVNNILLVEDLTSICLSFIEKNLDIRRGAFFILKSQDRTHYHFTIFSNLTDGLPDSLSLKKNTPLTRRLIDAGESISQYTLDVAPEYRQADETGIETLKRMAFEQFIPVKRHNFLIAILAVGPFASGAPYTLEDIELLATMADQTAIALENARLFKNVRYNLEEITRINDLMDNIFASIQSGVITVDTQNKITILNPAARRIFNLPPNIRTADSADALMHHLRSTPLPALLRDVKTTRRSYHAFEITQEIPGRGPVNLRVDLTPITNPHGQMQGVAIIVNDFTETKRLQVVQNIFRKYVSPAVVDRLPDDPEQLRLGGQRQCVTILFADIRGFSTFSEHLTPEDLINVLNRYLSMAAEAILAFEGTLDKFMGDAVMAIFNAPLPQPDHPLRAVKAALAMQRTIRNFHQILGEYTPLLNFGVGIHTGEAIIGNVGTQSRMDYTAVGDAVNLAKRLQENTPGGKILLSQATYEHVKDDIQAVFYKELTVKGRETPEKTYEVLGF